jgi:hypothetical protein
MDHLIYFEVWGVTTTISSGLWLAFIVDKSLVYIIIIGIVVFCCSVRVTPPVIAANFGVSMIEASF